MRAVGLPDDQEMLAELLVHYRSSLEDTYLSALRWSDRVPELSGITRDLVYRHALVLFATLDSLSLTHPKAAQAAQGAILAYSLPLICIDAQVDGSPSHLRRDELCWRRLESSLASSPVMHLGYHELALATDSVTALELVATTATDIIQSMRADQNRRWSCEQLHPTASDISAYWESPSSRLRGSGIARVMMGIASTLAGRNARHCDEVARSLGILRQIADELLDVAEDVRSGLITLPVAYALLDSPAAAELRSGIETAWRRSQGPHAKAGSADDALLRSLVVAGGGPSRMVARAKILLREATELAEASLPRPQPVVTLLRHRYYQAERAVRDNLSDTPRPLRVSDLVALDSD